VETLEINICFLLGIDVCTQCDSIAGRLVGPPLSVPAVEAVRNSIPSLFANSLLQDWVYLYDVVTLIEIQFEERFYDGI
jgi:hypothetical protein